MSFGTGDWVSTPTPQLVHAEYPLPVANLATLRGLDTTDINLAMIVGTFGGLTTPSPYSFFVRDRNDVTSADDGSTVIVGNAGARWKYMVPTQSNTNVINVQDPKFAGGASGRTNASATAAIQAAINSVPVAAQMSTAIYIPTGTYILTAGLTNNGRHVTFIGDGPQSSQLIIVGNFTVFNLDGAGIPAPCTGFRGISILESGLQTGMVGIATVNFADFFIQNCYITTAGKALDIGAGTNFTLISMLRIEAYGAQEAIRFKAGGGTWSNISCRKFRTSGVVGPTVWITGQSTSLVVTNCSFAGKGTHKSIAITNITNAGATFAITLASANYIAGETLLVRGTGTVYDGCWQVTSVVGAVVTVTAATGGANINPVAAFLDKLHSTVCLDNTLGPVNESLWTNVLFEGVDDGGSAGGTGSVSVMMDCTGGVTQMAGHSFQGCMFDAGQTSVMMIGKNGGGGDYLLSDIKFNSSILRYARSGFYMREVRGVQISMTTGDCIRQNADAKDLAISSHIVLDVNGATASQPIIGVNISNSMIGRQSSYLTGGAQAAFSPNFGIRITGTPQDIKLNGCHIHGLTAPIGTDLAGNVISTNTRLVDTDCTYNTAGAESVASVIQNLASAASILVPYGKQFNITGAVACNTLTGGWIGREVHFVTAAALQFNTGVNIANALLTVAGQLVLALYDGAAWHLR